MTKPTNVWIEEHQNGVEIELPHRTDKDGNPIKIRVRSVSTGFMLRSGRIPDALSQAALNAANIGDNGDMSKIDAVDLLKKSDEYQEIICREVLVSPKIVDHEPKNDNEINYWMLDDADIDFINREIVDKPLAALKSFRHENGAGAEPVRTGEIDGAKSKPDSKS